MSLAALASPEPQDDESSASTVALDPCAGRAAGQGAVETVVLDPRVPACQATDLEPTVLMERPLRALPDVTDSSRRAAETSAGAHQALERPTGAVRYVVVGVAGRGGMGTVHVAQDVDLLRRVALKELASGASSDRGARARFVREVQVTAQLDHPHIVPVYSLEVAPGGQPAYAMKLVEGQTFAQLIADTRTAYGSGRHPDERHALAVRLEQFLKVCDALAYAHARGVVHRDLKPANLMLGRHNEVYVMDWGICRVVEQSSAEQGAVERPGVTLTEDQTACGSIVGTPAYMSPEQAQGRHDTLGPASDQCALGLILHELVTLDRPYLNGNVLETLRRAAAGERRAVAHAFGERVPPELVAIIERATALEPERRYSGVEALADDVRRFIRGEAVMARPDSTWEQLLRRLSRHRQAVALAVLAFAVVAFGTIAGLLWRHDKALEADERRDHRMQAFTAEVAGRGDDLQTRLLQLNGELESLAAAAAYALEFGSDASRAVPWASSYDDRVGSGPDVLFGTSRGVAPSRLRNVGQRLAGLGALLPRVDAAVRELLGGGAGVDDSGLREVRAGFESGLTLAYPAAALARMAPDVRESSWYRSARERGNFKWTLVDVDQDEDRELAVETSVRDTHGSFLGAMSLVVSLDRVLTNVFAQRGVHGARAAFLMDAAGQVLARHEPARFGDGQTESLPRVLWQEVGSAMRTREAGAVETTQPGYPAVVAFDRIHPSDWTLLVVIDEVTLSSRD